MKALVIVAMSVVFALACPQGGGCKGKCGETSKTGLQPVKFALYAMQMHKEPDIKLAMKSYTTKMASIPKMIDFNAALGDEEFNKERFVKATPAYQRAEAKADLFETIYLVLNKAQRAEFKRLTTAYVYAVKKSLRGTACGSKMGGACGPKSGKNCQGKGMGGGACR